MPKVTSTKLSKVGQDQIAVVLNFKISNYMSFLIVSPTKNMYSGDSEQKFLFLYYVKFINYRNNLIKSCVLAFNSYNFIIITDRVNTYH